MKLDNLLKLGAMVVSGITVTVGVACNDSKISGEIEDTSEYIAVVRGQLASSDMDAAQRTHDAIAAGGEQQARDSGDHAHDVLLGSTMLDSTENEFLAIDRWSDRDAMLRWYADPEFQSAFESLFAGAPSIEFFERVDDWEHWGTMDAGDTFDPYFFHLALGTLARDETEANRQAHNAVASGGKQPSLDAGNVAHIPFTGIDDPRRFVAVDIWSVGEPVEPFYSSPEFRGAFEPLFESVTEPVYQSTEWHQW